MSYLRKIIRDFLNQRGYEIIKVQKALTTVKQNNWLHRLGIETVIDVGANEGQFIGVITQTIAPKRIYAFEPILACYQRLREHTKNLPVTAFQVGLSDYNGSSEINISQNLVSSSILEIDNLHTTLYPESKYTKTETIKIARMDDVMKSEPILGGLLIKIDVQGYEEKVLKGGRETVMRASAVIIESSFRQLYQEQWLFHQVYAFFADAGFVFFGLADQILSKSSGIPLFGDAIFIRKDLIDKVS